MRPSKEAQDRYFREHGLDPWGYDNPFVRDRLAASLAFIQKFVPPDFGGTFAEIGAFNGQFTRMLAKAFPKATIAASDIVCAPWETAGPFPGKVRFQWCDMEDFKMPEAPGPTILLLLECLYYVPEEERGVAAKAILAETRPSQIFVSGPKSKLARSDIELLFGPPSHTVQVSWPAWLDRVKNLGRTTDLGIQFLHRIDKDGDNRAVK